MIRKIILDNYMSHAHTVIEPATGLTVLVGPNNCGKSAVVSALETLARNTAGNFMVRHGEKEARVTVETDDGPDDRHVLVWRRKASGSPSYVIDGREVHRLNRDVPEDLHQFLKLPKVQLNETDEPFDVHFGQQKSPIFLLNESESRAAMFFSASSDAGRLLEIQDRHRDKVRLQKNRKRDTETQISRLDAQLEKLAEIDRVAPLMEAAEKEHQEIADELSAITVLEQTIRQIESAGAHLTVCRARATAHESLQPPPAQLDVAPLTALIESLQGQSKTFERSRTIGDALTNLQSAPALVDTTPLEQAITALARTVGQLKIHAGRSLTLSPLYDPPAIDDPKHVAESIKAIESGTRSLLDRRAAAISLAELRDPPAMLDPAPLEMAIKICSDAAQRSVFCMASVVKTVKQLQQAEEEIKAWAHDNPNCPVCGSAISADQLLEAGGHRHG